MSRFSPEQQRRAEERIVEILSDGLYDSKVLARWVARLEIEVAEAREQRALACEELDLVSAERDKLREVLRNYERDLVPKMQELQDKIQRMGGRVQ